MVFVLYKIPYSDWLFRNDEEGGNVVSPQDGIVDRSQWLTVVRVVPDKAVFGLLSYVHSPNKYK